MVFDNKSGLNLDEVNQDKNLVYDQNTEVFNIQDAHRTAAIEPNKVQVHKDHSACDVTGDLDADRKT